MMSSGRIVVGIASGLGNQFDPNFLFLHIAKLSILNNQFYTWLESALIKNK